MAKALILGSFNDGRTTFLGFHFRGRHFRKRSCLISCRAPDQNISKKSDYLDDIQSEIHLYLKKSIPPITHPILDVVFEPMHHLTLSAPPRTRAPALCIASCELIGGADTRYSHPAMAAASAIHLVHAASYAHENINTSTPSGQVQVQQHKFRPNIELLTGDGILPFGFELLARSMELSAPMNKEYLADRILRVIVEISRVAGSKGIMMKKKNKEGELYACGAACGGILGGGSEEDIEKLRKYGFYAGMIQWLLVHGNTNNDSNSNTELMVKELRGLAMEELASYRETNQKIVDYIYDILHN